MADRSVKVRLDCDVKPYIAAMAKAEAATKKFRDSLGDSYEPWEKETQRQKTKAPKDAQDIAGAFARSFSRSLEQAFRSLPKAEITADSTDAQIKLASIRQAMQDLSDKRIGVDINAASALGELRALQMELERLGTSAEIDVRADAAAALSQLQNVQREVDRLGGETARVDVDADTGAAQSKLAATNAEVNRLNGRSARVKVDADVGGALAAIAVVGAALAALPSAVTIGVGVAGLGAAFGAAAVGAGAFASVAIPSLGRINEALDQTTSSAGGAGAAVKSAAQKAAEAASAALRLAQAQDQVKDSADRVKAAQRSVQDSLRDVARAKADVTRAAEDAADRQAQAASRIADAERSVQDAHRATQRAIEDLTRARERAQERIEDLALATEGGALSEERALLSIRRAQMDLARVNADPKASQYDKDDAALRLKEAEYSLKRIKEANGDLAKEQADADRKGVEGSDEVVAAKERVAAAQRAEADAERSVAEARAAANAAAVDGARSVADAQDKVAEAQRKVVDAQQAVIKAERDHLRAIQALKVEQMQQKAALEALAKSAGGGGGAASKMAELSKAERELARDIKAFKDEYVAWQRSLQPDVLPVIAKGLDVLRVGMDRATPLVKGGAKGLLAFGVAAEKALKSKQWTDFFDDLGKKAPRAIEGLGNAAINVAGGLAGVVQAFLPYTETLTNWVEDITQDFETWGQNLAGSNGFKEFLAYAAAQGPKVAEILGNIATFVGKVVQAGANVGPGVLDFLVGLSDKLASLDPAQIEAVAKGVGLVFAAMKLGATLKIGAFVLLAEVLSKMSPGEINALAFALAGIITVVKGYQVFSAATGWMQGFRGSLDHAGKSADGAKGKFSGLAGSLKTAGIAGLLVGAAAGATALADEIQGLNPDLNKLTKGLIEFGRSGKAIPELLDQMDRPVPFLLGIKALDVGQWENLGQSASRLVSDNVFAKIATGFYDVAEAASFGLVKLDSGATRINNIDAALAAAVQSGNAAEVAESFKKIAQQALDAGTPVSKLRDLFPEYVAALEAAEPGTEGVAEALELLGGKADASAAKVRDLGTAIGELTQKAFESERANQAYEAALDGATAAVQRNGATLNIHTEAGRQNRDALVEVADKANAVRTAMEEQNAPMSAVTEKLAEQREAFIKVAMEMGLSKKAAKELADQYGLIPGSVTTKIFAETDKAQGIIDRFVKLNDGRIIQIGVDVRSDLQEFGARRPTARGAIDRYAAGGITRMAAGGVRPQPPALVSKPTVLFGEGTSGRGATEAFIPYQSQFRPRAIQLLGQVASDFGLELYNAQAGKRVDSLAGGIKEAQTGISAGLSSATSMLSQTLGSAGSLTSSITSVCQVGQSMTAGWVAGSAALTDQVGNMTEVMSGSVAGLTASVAGLTEQIGEATSWSQDGQDRGNGGRQPSTNPRSTGSGGRRPGGSQGAVIGPNPNVPPPGIRLPNGDFVALAGGGILDRPTLALMGEAGREAVIPLDDPKRGRAVLGQTAQMLGVPTNRSKVSRPQQMRSYVMAAPQGGSGGSAQSSGGAQAAGKRGALVNVESLQVREHADIDRIGAALYSRLGDKGP